MECWSIWSDDEWFVGNGYLNKGSFKYLEAVRSLRILKYLLVDIPAIFRFPLLAFLKQSSKAFRYITL